MRRREFLHRSLALGALLSSGCMSSGGSDGVRPIPKRTIAYVGLADFWAASTNGRFAAFLALPTENGGKEARVQVQVFNTKTHDLWVASMSRDGKYCDGDVDSPSLSASGRQVAFQATASNLVPGAPDVCTQMYVADQDERSIRRISATAAGGAGNGSSFDPYFSADARTVVFLSKATDLTDPPLSGPERHVVAWNRASGRLTLVSAAADGTPGNGPCSEAMVGRNGRFVTFSSSATNLGVGAANGLSQIYVRDLETGTLKWVSRGETARCACSVPRASAGARHIVYEASSDEGRAIYMFDDESATVTRISPTHYANHNLFRYPSITANGRYVAFLVPTSESECDVLIYDHESKTTLRVASQASFVRHHLPRVLRDGSAVWLVGDPAALGETPSDEESPLADVDAREVIAIGNPFL